MCTEAELYDIFQETGKHFGFLNVKVEFASFSGFKVQWHRTNNWIELKITDYLKDAPESVLEDLALSIFSKIEGKERGYGKLMRSFIKDRRFAENNREKYLKRTGMMMSGPHGEVYDLQEIYGNLVGRGLLDNVKDIPKDKIPEITKVVRENSYFNEKEIIDGFYTYCFIVTDIHPDWILPTSD